MRKIGAPGPGTRPGRTPSARLWDCSLLVPPLSAARPATGPPAARWSWTSFHRRFRNRKEPATELSDHRMVAVGGLAFSGADALAEWISARLSAGADSVVLVQADRGVAYGDVARVLSACRRAGVEDVALAAEHRAGS